MVYHIFSVNEPRGNCIWIVFETVPSNIRRKFNWQKLYTITSRPQRSSTHDLRAFGVKSVSTGRGREWMCMCRAFPVNERIGIAQTQVGNLNFRWRLKFRLKRKVIKHKRNSKFVAKTTGFSKICLLLKILKKYPCSFWFLYLGLTHISINSLVEPIFLIDYFNNEHHWLFIEDIL